MISSSLRRSSSVQLRTVSIYSSFKRRFNNRGMTSLCQRSAGGTECFQDLADRAWEFAFRIFPGGWVGIGSHLVHLLHPELAHQDLQGGYEWDGEEDSYEAEECAHYQDGDRKSTRLNSSHANIS